MTGLTTFLLGYAAERALDHLLFSRSLPGKLSEATREWSRRLPEELFVQPEALFVLSPAPLGAAGEREGSIASLQAEFGAGQIPTAETWLYALEELWRTRKAALARDAQPLFLREAGEVRPFLADLASRLRDTCIDDRVLFQREVIRSQGEVLRRLDTLRDRGGEGDAALQAFLDAQRRSCLFFPYTTFYDRLAGGLPSSLDEVFVPLPLRPGGSEQAAPLTLTDLMAHLARESARPALVLGEPGSGKSTLLRRIGAYAFESPGQIGAPKPFLPLVLRLRWLANTEGASIERRILNALEYGGELILEIDPPQGFFRRWPEQAGCPWLLLLDGLDEVPGKQVGPLLSWLQQLAASLARGGHRLILTSRPFGGAEALRSQVDYLRLDTFHGRERRELAGRWFPEGGAPFLEALERLPRTAAAHTPLLLSIAAAIFRSDGVLPNSRATLYDRFIDICFAEAERQGMHAELDRRVAKLARPALEAIAFQVADGIEESTRALASRLAAEYFREALRLAPPEAEADGEHFIEVLSLRSGILTAQGHSCAWIHPSFGEFLAASSLARRHDPADPEMTMLFARWSDPEWREILSFLVSMWIRLGRDPAPAIEALLDGYNEAVFFVGPLLDELDLSERARRLLVEQTCELIRLGRRDIWTGRSALDVLLRMDALQPDDVLARIIESDRFTLTVKTIAVDALLKRGHKERALRLLSSAALFNRYTIVPYLRAAVQGGWVDELIVRGLSMAKRGAPEHSLVRATLKGLQCSTVTGLSEEQQAELYVRLYQALKPAGFAPPVEGAVDVLSSEACIQFCGIAVALGAHGLLNDLAGAGPRKLRLHSLLGLIALGRVADAQAAATPLLQADDEHGSVRTKLVAALDAMARGDTHPRAVRLAATETMVAVGETDGLGRLLEDPAVDPSVQEYAAKGLAKLGANAPLLACARSSADSAWARYSAARALLESGAPEAPLAVEAVRADRELPAWIRTHIEDGFGPGGDHSAA